MHQQVTPPFHAEELSGPKLKVCVTGATGYVGSHILARLLAAGHIVHAPVRTADAEKQAFLAGLPGASERLRLFPGADLMITGSFDAAIADCDVVIHTASPYIVNVPRGQEWTLVVDPAVKGTENVLASVNRTRSVQRVIMTSSTTAVFSDPEEQGKDHVYTEADWNTSATAEELPYFYSKRASEQRAYQICEQQSRWKLCTIVPGSVWGPPLSRHMAGSESVSHMIALLQGSMWPGTAPLGMTFIDVRDLALAHCLAMVKQQASGRYLVSAASFWPLWFAAKVLKRRLDNSSEFWLPITLAPQFLLELLGPLVGLPAAFVRVMYKKTPKVSCQHAADELGMKDYIDPETTVVDMAQAVISLGLI